MANEISLSVTMSASKGGASESVSASTAITMINEDMVSATMIAPLTSDTTTNTVFVGSVIPFGTCIKGGLILIKNLSTDILTAARVDVAKGTSSVFSTVADFTNARILSVGAGEVAVFRTLLGDTSSAYYVRSSSTEKAPFIQITMLEP